MVRRRQAEVYGNPPLLIRSPVNVPRETTTSPYLPDHRAFVGEIELSGRGGDRWDERTRFRPPRCCVSRK